MRVFTVDQKSKLLEYLFEALKDTKKARVREYLKRASVLVNGKPTTQFDYPLVMGDKVSIKSTRDPRPISPPEHGIEVLYDDPSIVVIHKPSGLLSIATDKELFKTAIYATNEYIRGLEEEKMRQAGRSRNLSARDKQIFIVHRLDKDASGLLVFAKNEEVKKKLQTDWDKAEKKYFAIIEGVPKEKKGMIKSYLHESPTFRVYSGGPEEGGKLSITKYEVLRSSSNFSLVEVQIETGRKHQIRVHLSDKGHPIVGDERYGSRTNPLRRLALHAYYLSIEHPTTGKTITFHSPLPRTFDQVLNSDKLK